MIVEITRSIAEALRDFVSKRQSEMLSLTRMLVEQESPSGDFEGSRAVVNILAEEAGAIAGVESVRRIPATENYGEHLRIEAFGEGKTNFRSTLLVGHTDTVYPRGSTLARPWREEHGGRIYAPGIYDMKANCALALEALRACSKIGVAPSRRIVLLLTCDEEAGSMNGGRRLVEEEACRADSVLVLEPSAAGGRVKTARKGTGVFTMHITGQAAHAGLEPEKGASAISEIARQITQLNKMNDPVTGTTINVGVVSGGTCSNVVAAQAQAEIDVRFTTLEEAKRIENVLRNLQPFDDRVRISMRGGINRPPLERTEAVVSLYNHARRIAAQIDFELGETSVGGASDGNFAAAVGTGAVLDGLGIEGAGAHAAHEHILISDIAQRGALLAGLIASL